METPFCLKQSRPLSKIMIPPSSNIYCPFFLVPPFLLSFFSPFLLSSFPPFLLFSFPRFVFDLYLPSYSLLLLFLFVPIAILLLVLLYSEHGAFPSSTSSPFPPLPFPLAASLPFSSVPSLSPLILLSYSFSYLYSSSVRY